MAIWPMKPLNDNLQKAVPEIAPFWMYHIIGIDNYDINIYDHFRNGDIEVIRDTIVSMKGNTIALASQTTFTTDAVIFGTGWKTNLSLFSENKELEMQLGLPTTSYTKEYTKKWADLEAEADKVVFAENPALKNLPKIPRILPPEETGPFRLYHYAIPTNFTDRSIAFLGMVQTPSTVHYGIVMALWTAAYFSGKLDPPSVEEMEKVAAYELRFNRIRHLGASNEFPFVVSDFTSV
ncbi:hypothetical protein ABW20_dc0102478 [Dactylellina cionopaga]|nr:hypothetical protein ABW20_dc0102478 [Dactylellina cionopaga]